MKQKSLHEKVEFLSKFIYGSYPFLKKIHFDEDRDFAIFLYADVDYFELSKLSNIPLKESYSYKIKNGKYNFVDGWSFLSIYFDLKKESGDGKYFDSLQKEINSIINMLNNNFITEENRIDNTIFLNKFFIFKE